MSTTHGIVIVKRDGSLESFSARKLRRIIAAAMRQCRYDPKLADPLVQAVEVHLQYWEENRPPTSEYVFRCVHAVLKQTGLKDVAECLAGHRRWRRLKRRSIRVLRVAPKRGSVPWRKTTLVRRMTQRYGVGAQVARIVAGELEQRVLNLGFRTVSGTLIEELLRNELLAWGLLETEVVATPAAYPEPQA